MQDEKIKEQLENTGQSGNMPLKGY